MSDLIIETKNLSRFFYQGKNAVQAVKNVNLTIAKGEKVAIIGPSGAGKSTLLHMMGGLDTPTAGSVLFEGIDLYKLNQKIRAAIRNKKIGFVFQFYHLLPEFTVLENVLMPALINKKIRNPKSEIRKRAESLLGRMDLSHRLNHRPREISGGESQRVAIARALINEPQVLFCDEPTGNLDSDMGDEIYNIIFEKVKEKNMGLVVVTHQENRTGLFDRICYIKDGRMSLKESIWV